MDLFSKQYHTPGTTPGTLKQIRDGGLTLFLFDYGPQALTELRDIELEACHHYIENDNNTWIHIQGDPKPQTLHTLADAFGIHDLYLEDIVNTGQRPKLEILENRLFLILSLPFFDGDQFRIEQVCLFLTGQTVISFCTGNHDPFDLVQERIRKTVGKIRKRKSDYLIYTLIDAVIDHGYPLLESYASKIEEVEDAVVDRASQSDLQEIHTLRRELLLLRRKFWPQREVLNGLLRDDLDNFFSDETRLYLRDCYDHNITIVELIETYHEITGGLLDVYLSSVSQRLNDVMRVLTVISTLFIPPTFVVGVYGMNFRDSPYNMPELAWEYGYPMAWLIIIVMVVGMLVYFRTKKWF